MKRFVNTVTVTGADDSIDPRGLISIAQEYPYAEFALLCSRAQEGSRRFPSQDWLMKYFTQNLSHHRKTAIHLCGAWVRELLVGTYETDLHHLLSHLYACRVQLNTHGIKHKFHQQAVINFLDRMGRQGNYVIFQNDDANKDLLKTAQESGYHNISALFDLSHGAGVLPSEWPSPIQGLYCGYAGGLSPSNVEEQLTKLEPIVKHRHIWIDAETRLRSDNDQIFDLGLVRDFLASANDRVL